MPERGSAPLTWSEASDLLYQYEVALKEHQAAWEKYEALRKEIVTLLTINQEEVKR
jgi:hypothetical protein